MGRHSLFGLGVATEIPLPDLLTAEDAGEPDVTIRRGQVPPRPQGDTRMGLVVTPAGAILDTEAGRYFIRDGREIIVEPGPDASERNVRLYLLGSAFGAILHQRGLLPLHANAIEIEGRAIAFMGHSGAGKSTMAAWFHDRGFRILADDVCVVTMNESRPIAYPGIPRLRLWREALELSGREAGDYDRSFDDMDKYDVPTLAQEVTTPIELDHVYLLKQADPASGSPGIRRLSGVEAVDALVANTYRGAFLPLMDGTKQHLLQCLALVNKVPIFTAERVWGFDTFDEQAQRLEAHARSVLAH